MDVIYKFILWFAISLVGVFFLITTFSNPFVNAFIIALVISILANREKW